MKKIYRFSTGESFEAENFLEVQKILHDHEQYLQNDQELFENKDDSEYVARGNGFCDSKFSDSFLEGQIDKYQQKVNELKVFAKQALRADIKVLKKQHTAEQLYTQSQRILQKLEQTKDFQQADKVMIYSALPDEVQTAGFLKKWCNKKQLILPTVVGDDIVPVALTATTIFKEGDFHILEPQNAPYDGDFDLMIVPGVAFDRLGNRLGRGRGYYDRFLAKHLSVKRIGICFDFQLVDEIPTEPTDIKMHAIISL